jgi:hypothetical protein
MNDLILRKAGSLFHANKGFVSTIIAEHLASFPRVLEIPELADFMRSIQLCFTTSRRHHHALEWIIRHMIERKIGLGSRRTVS